MTAWEAYKLARDNSLVDLKPILDQVRAAALKGLLRCKLEKPPSDLEKRILIGDGYGFDADGSIQWSGCDNINDPIGSKHS